MLDPNQIHEALVYLLLPLFGLGVLNAILYLRSLVAFFAEVRLKEPELWTTLGEPTLYSLITEPYKMSRKYAIFLPYLKERAGEHPLNYTNAKRTMKLLRSGLLLAALMFALCGFIIFWILYNDL